MLILVNGLCGGHMEFDCFDDTFELILIDNVRVIWVIWDLCSVCVEAYQQSK